MAEQEVNIDGLLSEGRVFAPPTAFTEQAVVSDNAIYAQADEDFEAFWEEQARQLAWSKPWETTLDWQPPWVKWFVGGTLNASYNCLDRHVESGGGDKVAFHWEGEPGDVRTHHLQRPLRRSLPLRERAEVARRARRATGWRSTSGWCRSCRWRCSRARGSARRTRSSSAGSRRRR